MKRIFITSWDDGRKQDLELAAMLLNLKIPAIFYIPTCTELSDQRIIDLARHFEIGGHTKTHPQDLKLLDDAALLEEIGSNAEWLRGLTGQRVTSFCYPRGRYNDNVIEVVKAYGFENARTTVVLNTEIPIDSFRIKTTIHVHPSRVEYGGRKWFELANELWEWVKNEGGYFHLWGHSWEIEKYQLWDELESFLRRVAPDLK